MNTREQLIKRVRVEFKHQFKIESEHVSLTPGRINIIGEHTDYNNGLAMPTTIDRWICSAICRSNSKSSTIFSLNYNDNVLITPHVQEKFQELWKQLSVVTIHTISTEFGIEEGVNMVMCGNIPIGSGMSSSSAFVISITQTFFWLFSIQIEDRQLAYLCQKIENSALGTSGGLLDQYGIILSKKDHLMLVDFLDDSVEFIPTDFIECSWIVINSHVSRELSESAYIQRVNECREGLEILKNKCNISSFRNIDKFILETLKNESHILYKRLCHVVDENQRVREMKDQLQQGMVHKAGRILTKSHNSLKFLYEVSCEEIDYIIEISEAVNGWYGGRIMGGGFGGCSIHLISDETVEDFIDHITVKYINRFQITPGIMEVTFPGGLEKLS